MTNLFISYRRSDSEGYAGRIYDHLTRLLDDSDVFMDVDSIAPGANFVEMLNKTLAEIDVMLVIIGSTWLTARDEKGRRRLDQKEDFVFQEIAAALSRDIAVIPVLIGKAEMPTATDLPDGIMGLASRNAVSLRHNSFSSDMRRLADAIKDIESANYDWRIFGQEITDEYNNHFIRSATGEDYKLQLIYGSDTSIGSFFHSHLLKDAIVNLIVEADTSGWMKHEKELQPEVFWDAILKAVATSYRIDYGFAVEEKSDAEILRMYIENLE